MHISISKKKPVIPETADKYEKAHPGIESDSTIEARKQKAYKNGPAQFPLILADIFSIDMHRCNISYSGLSGAVEFCKQIFEILEKCEFFEFTESEFKTFVHLLNEMGCTTYDEFHSYYKPTGSRNLAETLGLRDNIEAPIEIFDRLNKAENFDFMRILIQNGALRKWVSAQAKTPSQKNGSDDGSPKDGEAVAEIPVELGE